MGELYGACKFRTAPLVRSPRLCSPRLRSGQAGQAGQTLRKRAPRFKKLDESLADEEYERLEAWPTRVTLD